MDSWNLQPYTFGIWNIVMWNNTFDDRLRHEINPWSCVFEHGSLVSIWFLMCCSLLLKTTLGRRRQRLQIFPHHQMHCLAETAPVAGAEGSIIPGVIYFGWSVAVLGIFLACASCCLAEFSTRSCWGRKKGMKTDWTWHTKSWSDQGPIHGESW